MNWMIFLRKYSYSSKSITYELRVTLKKSWFILAVRPIGLSAVLAEEYILINISLINNQSQLNEHNQALGSNLSFLFLLSDSSGQK